MKFKNFSSHIQPATNILTIFLAILSILGFIFIFYIFGGKQDNYDLKINDKQINNSQNLEQDIVGEEYY